MSERIKLMVVTEKLVYSLQGRNISLDKKLVEKYSENVCPLSEKIMLSLIFFLGKDCDDNDLSQKIEADMEEELKEYGL